MAPYSVPQGVYSHIYFAFGSIDPNTFQVIPAQSGDEQLYLELAALQMRDLDQELWLSIGGWDFSDSDQPTATTFSDLVGANSATQNAFFKSLINFMGTYGFTGVDIDWEYPAATDRNGRAEDFQNYPKFLANLKKALSDYKYGLSITLPTSYWYLQHFDLTAIEPSVDWFNVMTYDLHGTWDTTDVWTGPYLDAHTNLTEIKSALDLLWGVNLPPSKVNLGLAFYGRSFTIAGPSCSTPGCQYLSAGTAGNCSQSAGILFNSEIEALINDQNLTATLYPDAAVKSITWDTDQWVSFDDQDTWALKADYAKSVCLGGVMVWSIDEDDELHTFSNGLAAALGNPINLDTTTGLPLTISDKSTVRDSRGSSQSSYCRFINCGQTCPNGFSTIVREDNTNQLMLDSTECDPGSGQTQTLCCPKSSYLPTCRWRGFNGGNCNGACQAGEAEVGTITAGCRVGHQSACCTITESTEPWSQCAWTAGCHPDQTCLSGYDVFVVGSRQGWGGRNSCKGSNNYNYCCKSSIPDAFTNCAWTGHEVPFVNQGWCTDACPSGSIRIAEESIDLIWGGNKKPHTPLCVFGKEAYCCNGTASTIAPRAAPTTFADQTAYEFHYYLNEWLSDPTCFANEDAEFGANFQRRDLNERSYDSSTSSKQYLYDLAVMYTVNWLTSNPPRSDLTSLYNDLMNSHGYAAQAANLTILQATSYGFGDPWTGSPLWDPTQLVSQTFCDIAASTDGVQSLGVASDVLCAQSTTSSLSKRMLDGITDGSGSTTDGQPAIITALRGVVNGDLTFHYGRWLQTRTMRQGHPEVILELAFWIGPTPGTPPTAAMLSTYGDSGDTVYSDLWIVFHLHIPRSSRTFNRTTTAGGGVSPGVAALGLFHSQTLRSLRNADPRAESRFSTTDRSGYNIGSMLNYNERSQALDCPTNRPWYIGIDSTTMLQNRQRQGFPTAYAEALNSFGTWVATEGILSNQMLGLIWPAVGDIPQENGPGWNVVRMDGERAYNPTADAFTRNWNAAGSRVDISRSTTHWT